MPQTQRELIISRIIDASLERVWQAWTDQIDIQQWWGPKGVTNPTCIWQARPGGMIEIVMLASTTLGNLASSEWPTTGEFTEVAPQEKLLFIARTLADGKPILETQNTVTFEKHDQATKLHLDILVTKATLEAEDSLAGMEMGWNESIDKLASYLHKK